MIDDKTITTPAFLVDRSVVKRNCDRMREKASLSGVAFRPHVKTHKTVEIGRMQHGGTSGPITVSTLAEADFFAAGGFRDITWAVGIAPEKLGRAAGLQARVERLNLLVDSREAFQAIEAFHAAEGVVFDLFLKVDCGYHRAGVDPQSVEAVELANAMRDSKAMRFLGLLTHAGHSYHARNAAEIRQLALEERSALTRFRDRLGAPELVRSIGSTPTASVVDRFEDADEVRPGNYVFYDAFQSTIGSCAPADCAVSVLTTVIGSYPERGALLLDAGALALSKDPGPDHVEPRCGFGIVCDRALRPLPLRIVALSQEHGKVEGDRAAIERLPVGSRLRIVPNHSCLTAAMFETYQVIDGDAIVDEWRPARGW